MTLFRFPISSLYYVYWEKALLENWPINQNDLSVHILIALITFCLFCIPIIICDHQKLYTVALIDDTDFYFSHLFQVLPWNPTPPPLLLMILNLSWGGPLSTIKFHPSASTRIVQLSVAAKAVTSKHLFS